MDQTKRHQTLNVVFTVFNSINSIEHQKKTTFKVVVFLDIWSRRHIVLYQAYLLLKGVHLFRT
jgi:hypothetical protein